MPKVIKATDVFRAQPRSLEALSVVRDMVVRVPHQPFQPMQPKLFEPCSIRPGARQQERQGMLRVECQFRRYLLEAMLTPVARVCQTKLPLLYLLVQCEEMITLTIVTWCGSSQGALFSTESPTVAGVAHA